jgi:hypothetical protein
MPCACRKPEPAYPENDQWGPVLWKLLHSLAEHAGEPIQRNTAGFADEKRQWMNLVSVLPKMIPCDKCRAHCAEYLEHVPFDLKTVPDDELHEWIRNYFWEFHEHVNSGIGKPSFPKGDLTSTYRSVSVSQTLRTLTPFIETAIRLTGITLLPWQKFQGYVRMLSSIYGL